MKGYKTSRTDQMRRRNVIIMECFAMLTKAIFNCWFGIVEFKKNHNMKYFLLSFLIVGLSYACGSETDKVTEQPLTDTESEKPTPMESSAAQDEFYYLNTAVGAVPIHSNFDGIAPYFEKDNDTTYVINFWATWCKPCVEELPYFEQINELYKDEKVQVILVSMDFKSQIESKLKPFVEKYELQSSVVAITDRKYNNWIDKVDADWNGAIPVTLIYNGKRRMFVPNAFDNKSDLMQAVENFL